MRLAILCVLAACGSKTAPPAPIGNETAPTGDHRTAFLREGDYLCWGGFHEYLCLVRVVDGERHLDKVGGSDRYAGVLTPDDAGGFRLVGTNADGVALDLHFEPQADGSWRAAVPPAIGAYADHYTIRYKGELGSVFGSQTYGGGYDEPPP